MNIFISHSSKNKEYGQLLVDLMISLGIQSDKIIFTSNTAHGIPISENIFNWLKSKIIDKPYVIYLLSPEYYSSIACLNEMGAAWVIENEHSTIFTPNFDLNCDEFKNGALDPREIGFFINNREQLLNFVEILKKKFSINPNPVLTNQKIDECIKKIKFVDENNKNTKLLNSESKNEQNKESDKSVGLETKKKLVPRNLSTSSNSKFFEQILSGKTKPAENIMLYYALDTDTYKFGSGWQESNEIEKIKAWEEINEIDNILSRNYSSTLQKFKMRNLIDVSAETSHGNPKEYEFKKHVFDLITNIPESVHEVLEKTVKENPSW